jgi:phospholipase/carboxylesterase
MPSNTAHDLIIQQPVLPAAQLFLLFHGVGANPQGMRPLALQLAARFPQSMVVCVASPEPFDHAMGRSGAYQWFSVTGVTEVNRLGRVAQAMPGFEATVAHWQQVARVQAAATALVGFSQGAIMALESTKLAAPIAGRVLALGGRFAALPQQAPVGSVVVHLFHGQADPVMPFALAVQAARQLEALGCDVTADVLPDIGHEVHPAMVERLLERLSSHVPRHLWEGAEAAVAQGEPPAA